LFSPEEWEEFTEEWASSLKGQYYRVLRFGGPGDRGLDVVGLVKDETLQSGWDNYQCKYYEHSLMPTDVWVELGKIIYYSYSEEYPVPRKYYFIAPKGIGTSLSKLLLEPETLREKLRDKWNQYCEKGITSVMTIPLSKGLARYFDSFDFSIFSWKTAVDLIQDHAKTTFHAVRFGGGLQPRPPVERPPEEIAPAESRYIQQIFEAYSDGHGGLISEPAGLVGRPELQTDFLLQRERFYHAESLRNFARDTVPEGTFENLQEEVFHGVIDVALSEYEDGLGRMRGTIIQSARLSVTSSPLSSVVQVQDKQGICHQLANTDRLIWVPKREMKV